MYVFISVPITEMLYCTDSSPTILKKHYVGSVPAQSCRDYCNSKGWVFMNKRLNRCDIQVDANKLLELIQRKDTNYENFKN